MKLRTTSLAAAIALAACADPPPNESGLDAGAPAAAPATTLGPFAPDQVIVKLRTPYDGAAPLTLGGRRLVPIQQLPSGTWHMWIDDGATARRRDVTPGADLATLAAIADVRTDAAVEYAHENAALELSAVPNDPEAQPTTGRQAWSLNLANVYNAWNVTTGSSAVRIALIDSGRREHPEMFTRWGTGRDFIYNDNDPTDNPFDHPVAPQNGGSYDWAHGIHVAGIAGGRANNSIGGAGMCWNCQLLPYRVTPSLSTGINPIGITYISEIENAIRWAAGEDSQPVRAEVINMSFNHQSSTNCNEQLFTGLQTQITRAISRGVVVVASAGNRRFIQPVTPTSAARVPATCPGVISVMAAGPNGVVPEYTARGAGVDLVAPGGGTDEQMHYGEAVGCPEPVFGSGTNGVFSAWSYVDPTFGARHCYRHLSGTSMAAPHVAGVVALMRSVNPSLTPAQIEQYLLATAKPALVQCPAGATCGAGMLDAHAAVLAARDGLLPDIDLTPTSITFPPTRLTTTSAPQPLTVLNTAAGTLTATITAPAQVTLACSTGTCTCNVTQCTVSATSGSPTVVHVRHQPTVAGAFAANLTVTSNDPDEPTRTVSLAGTATYSDARLSPDILHFAWVNVGAISNPQQANIANAGTAPLVITGLDLSGDVSQYLITAPAPFPITVAPQTSVQLTVRCTPTSTGRKTVNIRLFSDANQTMGAPVNLRCDGVAPDARLTVASPGPAFGLTQLGTSAARAVYVFNIASGNTQLIWSLPRPAAPFALTCASGCTCNATTCSGVTGSGSSARLDLTYSPTALVASAATLTLTSNSYTQLTSPIQASGTGGTAVMTLIDPADGDVLLTEGALTDSAKIRNTGNLPLRLDGWRVDPSGEMASAFSLSTAGEPLPITLAPGAEYSWKVGCDPTWRTGIYSAKLLVDTNLGAGTTFATATCRIGPLRLPPEVIIIDDPIPLPPPAELQ